MIRIVRVLSLLAVGFAVTAGDTMAQRRPLPPDPRNPFAPPPSVGQQREGRWFLDVRAGLAKPAGDFAKAASSGVSLGFGVGWWARREVAVRLRTDIDLPRTTTIEEGINAGQEGPTWFVWHTDVGVSYDLTQGETPFLFAVDFGLGGTLIKSGEFQNREVGQWFGAVTPGIVFGYAVGSNATFTVDGRYQFLFGDKSALDSILTSGDTTLGHLQIQMGFRFLVSPGGRRARLPFPR